MIEFTVRFGDSMTRDEELMQIALEEAQKAASEGEVPIGAIIVKDGEILGRGHNLTETLKDPTAHAEMMAIKDALSKTRGNIHRLTGCSMYVTLEPCAMCAGAIVLARIKSLYIGAMDPKTGACGSLRNVAADERLNHRTEIFSGVLKDSCEHILKEFFRELRKNKN